MTQESGQENCPQSVLTIAAREKSQLGDKWRDQHNDFEETQEQTTTVVLFRFVEVVEKVGTFYSWSSISSSLWTT